MRVFIAGLFLIISTNYICAQNIITRHIGFGISGGFNYTGVRFVPGNNDDYLLGYSYGIFVNYLNQQPTALVNWPMGIQIEFNNTQQGWIENVGDSLKYKRTMSFYQAPILAHFKVGSKLLRFTFELGPYLGFYRDYNEEYKILINSQFLTDSATYIKNHYGQDIENNFDYGFSMGGGLGISKGAIEIIAKFRYTQSLTNIFPQFPNGDFHFSQMKGMYFGLSASYNFIFKPKFKSKQNRPPVAD